MDAGDHVDTTSRTASRTPVHAVRVNGRQGMNSMHSGGTGHTGSDCANSEQRCAMNTINTKIFAIQKKKSCEEINFVKLTKNIFQSTRLPEERMGVTKKNRWPQRIPVKNYKKNLQKKYGRGINFVKISG